MISVAHTGPTLAPSDWHRCETRALAMSFKPMVGFDMGPWSHIVAVAPRQLKNIRWWMSCNVVRSLAPLEQPRRRWVPVAAGFERAGGMGRSTCGSPVRGVLQLRWLPRCWVGAPCPPSNCSCPRRRSGRSMSAVSRAAPRSLASPSSDGGPSPSAPTSSPASPARAGASSPPTTV